MKFRFCEIKGGLSEKLFAFPYNVGIDEYKALKIRILNRFEALKVVALRCSFDLKLDLCYRRYTAMLQANSSGWVRAALEMANLDITFNAVALKLYKQNAHLSKKDIEFWD